MGTTYAIGSDGSVDLPSGFAAQLNTWSATINRPTQIVTGFTDKGQRRVMSNLVDISGSCGGVMKYNAAGTEPIPIVDSSSDAGEMIAGDANGGTIILYVRDNGTDSEDVKIAFDAVFSSYDIAVEQAGASTITFNFQMADSNGPTVTWYES